MYDHAYLLSQLISGEINIGELNELSEVEYQQYQDYLS